jgi:DNA-binding transcriptional LysR family regulator
MRTAPRAIEKAVQFQPETVSSFSQNRCPVWPEYASSALVQLFSGWQFDSMPLYVAYAPNRYASKQLRVFIEWITQLIAQHATSAP